MPPKKYETGAREQPCEIEPSLVEITVKFLQPASVFNFCRLADSAIQFDFTVHPELIV